MEFEINCNFSFFYSKKEHSLSIFIILTIFIKLMKKIMTILKDVVKHHREI